MRSYLTCCQQGIVPFVNLAKPPAVFANVIGVLLKYSTLRCSATRDLLGNLLRRFHGAAALEATCSAPGL